jgi:uncharacterized protein
MSPLPFLVIVFASTWLFQLPFLVAHRFAPLVVVGYFGPLIIAVLLSLREGGPRGLRALFRPLGIWRVNAGWYLIALGLPGAILLVATALYRPFGGPGGPWLHPPTDVQHVAAMLVIPFTEQIAWRGFAYPRLEQRFGPLVASVILGAAWALFHIQKHALLDGGVGLVLTPVLVLFMTAGTVVYTWIYRRTGGSLLLVVVANMGAYLNNSMQALPEDATPLVLHTAGYCVVALALVSFDRAAWPSRPQKRNALSAKSSGSLS